LVVAAKQVTVATVAEKQSSHYFKVINEQRNNKKTMAAGVTSSIFSFVHLVLRVVLATFSLSVLTIGGRLITLRFNITELIKTDLVWFVETLCIQQLTVVDNLTSSSSSSSHNSTANDGNNNLWYAFLYAEFTLSVLLPLGIHGLLTSTRRCDEVTSSISTYMVLAVILGLFVAHRCMDDVIIRGNDSEEGDDENSFERMVGRNKLLVMAILSFFLSYILVLGDESAKLSTNKRPSTVQERTTTPPTKENDGVIVYYTYQVVRFLVKLSGVCNILISCVMLYLITYSKGPTDLIPILKWGDFDMEITFGKDVVYSSEFYYVVVCTMLSTLMQTLVIELTTTFSPVWSDTASDALNYSMVGVAFAIAANLITMAIYGDDFKAGTDCTAAHIIMLVFGNCYMPIVWWIHRGWKNSNYNTHLHDDDVDEDVAASNSDGGDNDDKEKEE
jgi:hypothetical protein